MKIIFLSNYFNYHQAALSDALWEKTGGDFLFVETEPMPPERKQLGFSSLQRPYVLPWRGNEGPVRKEIREADAVIAGSAPEGLIRQRIKAGKLLFRYTERPLRNGPEILKYLPRWIRWHWRNPRGKPVYLLCASGYAAGDYARFGLFRGRTFRWGYFPETKIYEEEALFSEKDPGLILWCGRFLEWKHPADALAAAGRLKQEGYSFTMKFIGTGELETRLRTTAEELNLGDCVCFPGAMETEAVRQAMEEAGIYLFTSDRREGWGAVLNEAMNSGCAVITSREAGSAPFLVVDGRNGHLFKSGDVDSLCEKLRYLLEHPQEQKRLGMAAYETIRTQWNADFAAQRLLELTESLLRGESPPVFPQGPCSPAAEIREDGWI